MSMANGLDPITPELPTVCGPPPGFTGWRRESHGLVDRTAKFPNQSWRGSVHPSVEAAIAKVLAPTWPEVVRAKKLIMGIVSDGRAHGVRALQECLCDADGYQSTACMVRRCMLARPTTSTSLSRLS